MTDQASTLRRLMRTGEPAPVGAAGASSGPSGSVAMRIAPISVGPSKQRRERVRLARAFAIASGKGGVGKTNLAVNLAIALAASHRTCLLDADLGLANADVLCGLSPRSTLEEVLLRGRPLDEVMVLAPGGFRLLPGASGVASVANLGAEGRRRLIAELAQLERSTDLLLIDTAAGIAANTMAFVAAAHTTLVVVTPEPTAITDAYGTVKTLVAKVRKPSIKLLVNMATDREEGEEVYRRIDRVARTFLDTPLELAGIVPFDAALRRCVKRREPVLLAEPDCPASRAIRAIARGLVERDTTDPAKVLQGGPVGIDPSAFPDARSGFLGRLARWISRR